jgi:putative cell wall-binding protein
MLDGGGVPAHGHARVRHEAISSAARVAELRRVTMRRGGITGESYQKRIPSWLFRVGAATTLGLGTMGVAAFSLTDGPTASAVSIPGTAASAPQSHVAMTKGTAKDGLFPFTTVTGKVYMSLTGIGTNTPDGGPIYVQKDSSKSTVQAAYLLSAGIPGFDSPAYSIGDGTVELDGQSLSFTPADILTKEYATGFAVDNVWTNVTTIVAPVVDEAPAGLVQFTASEPTHTDFITGEILAVIMNDPTLRTDNTVSFLFGGLDPGGDSFKIGLAKPLKLSTPTLKLVMSIGDSFGYQGPPGTGQYSTITVDTKLMTSAAGGNDDSICKYQTPPDYASCGNGELITVGGIGDSTTDPADPTATTFDCATPPGPPRCTDELYTLLPFVSTGQTSITVKTTNPSENDDIFFTGFELNAVSAVVGQGAVLTPVTGTNLVGSPYTFTAKVQGTTGEALPEKAITLTVLSGPDAGKVVSSTTNSTGIATFTYTSTTVGTDVVRASFTGTSGVVDSNTAEVTWTTGEGIQPTTLTTSLSGGDRTGPSISVPPGTPVTDTAVLAGAHASTATGTVRYTVYTNAECTTVAFATEGQEITTPGSLPSSTPVTFTTDGTYYWEASYSGDETNGASTSTCGATGEVETVTSSTPPKQAPPPPPPGPAITAAYGSTAGATAATEFTRAFPYTKGECPTSRAAVIATTKVFQDALSSQYLAQDLTTGTLLTPILTLNPVTATTLRKEGINTVYIVGGPLAIDETVARQIADMTAYECGGTTLTPTTGKVVVHRVWGKTQYGTSKAVAEFVGTGASMSFTGAYAATNATAGTGLFNDTAGGGTSAPGGSEPTAILASGQEFQDAQAASVISYHTRVPLLLTATTTLTTTVVGAVKQLGIKQVILMGGTEAVTNTVEAGLVAKTGVSVLRVAGKTYTDTAGELARFEASSAEGLGWTPGHRIMVTRGDGFTDGIAGAVLDSRHNTATGPAGTVRPLLLTESPTTLGTNLATFLKVTGHTGIGKTAAKTITSLTVLGGPLAVSSADINAMQTDLSS